MCLEQLREKRILLQLQQGFAGGGREDQNVPFLSVSTQVPLSDGVLPRP